MWVKFKKGHPAFSYFVGDVADISDEAVEHYGLNENGYTVPATKAEKEAARAALEAEKLAAESEPVTDGGLSKAVQLIQEQQAEISQLRESLSVKTSAPVDPAKP